MIYPLINSYKDLVKTYTHPNRLCIILFTSLTLIYPIGFTNATAKEVVFDKKLMVETFLDATAKEVVIYDPRITEYHLPSKDKLYDVYNVPAGNAKQTTIPDDKELVLRLADGNTNTVSVYDFDGILIEELHSGNRVFRYRYSNNTIRATYINAWEVRDDPEFKRHIESNKKLHIVTALRYAHDDDIIRLPSSGVAHGRIVTVELASNAVLESIKLITNHGGGIEVLKRGQVTSKIFLHYDRIVENKTTLAYHHTPTSSTLVQSKIKRLLDTYDLVQIEASDNIPPLYYTGARGIQDGKRLRVRNSNYMYLYYIYKNNQWVEYDPSLIQGQWAELRGPVHELYKINQSLRSSGHPVESNLSFARDKIKAVKFHEHKLREIKHLNILKSRVNTMKTKSNELKVVSAQFGSPLADPYVQAQEAKVREYRSKLASAKKALKACYSAVFVPVAYAACAGVLKKQVDDFSDLVDKTNKLIKDKVKSIRTDKAAILEKLKIQLESEYVHRYSMYDEYLGSVLNIEKQRLAKLHKNVKMYNKDVKVDVKNIVKAEEKLRKDSSIKGIINEVIDAVPGVKLIKEIPKIVGQTERLIKEVKRIEKAIDKPEMLIEDIEESIGLPLVEGLRQVGLYDDPNSKSEKIKLYVTKLHNFEDIRAHTRVAEEAEYMPPTDPRVMLYKENIKLLRSGFDDHPLLSGYRHVSTLNKLKKTMQKIKYKHMAYNLFTHVLGFDYNRFAGKFYNKDVITKQLLDFLLSPVTQTGLLQPLLISDAFLSGYPATFFYNDDDAYILLNKDMKIKPAARFTHYIEELGSMLSWSRCKLRWIKLIHTNCFKHGDEGAKFVDASAYFKLSELATDSNVLSKNNYYEEHLTKLSGYRKQSPISVVLKDHSVAYMNGFPNIDHFGDFVAGGDRGQVMGIFQLGIEVPSEYTAVYEKFAGQLIYYAPRLRSKSNPTKFDSSNKDNNIPTFWLQVAFHDEINAFVGRKFTGMKEYGDVGGLIIRNHGVELPFQKQEKGWTFVKKHMTYYKEDILRLELAIRVAQLVLKKVGGSYSTFGKLKGTGLGNMLKYLNSASQTTVGLEFGLAFKFPYANKAQFYGAFGIDIATNILGAVGGAFAGSVTGQDPVTAGEIGAILGDLVGSGIEEGIFGALDSEWVGVTFSLPFDYNMSFGGKTRAASYDLTRTPRRSPYVLPSNRSYADAEDSFENTISKRVNMFQNLTGVFAFYPRYVFTVASRSGHRCGLVNRKACKREKLDASYVRD